MAFSTADFFSPFIGMFGSALGSLIAAAGATKGQWVDPHPEDAAAWAAYVKENRNWSAVTDPRVKALLDSNAFPGYSMVSHHRKEAWLGNQLRRRPDLANIHPPKRFRHVNGPQTAWHPEIVKDAKRLGVHPSRLDTTPYAARYSHRPGATAHQAKPGIQPAFGDRGGMSVLYGGASLATPIMDLSTVSGDPLIIPEVEAPPHYYVIADSRAPDDHPLNWPGSPTVIPRPGDVGWHGEPIGYAHRPSIQYTPEQWGDVMGFSMFPDLPSATVPGQAFIDQGAALDQALARVAELELGSDEPRTEVLRMEYPGGISQEAFEWYVANRPGYADLARSWGYDVDVSPSPAPAPASANPAALGRSTVPPASGFLNVTPYRQPTALELLQAQNRGKKVRRKQEASVMGWFDSLIDVLPTVLEGTAGIIGATRGQQTYYPPPQTLPTTSWSGGPAGGDDMGFAPALFEQNLFPSAPPFFPGMQLGEAGSTPYGDSSSMFYQTAAGTPRTRDLLEAVDWNGDRRYWVGGKKLSKRWIKNKILQESRAKRRCPR